MAQLTPLQIQNLSDLEIQSLNLNDEELQALGWNPFKSMKKAAHGAGKALSSVAKAMPGIVGTVKPMMQ